MTRISDKLIEIEKYLEELESILPLDFKEYKKNFKIKAVGERYFEKIVEAVIDLAFLVAGEKRLRKPEEEEGIFSVLKDNKILSEELCLKLQDAKGMRNIISHQYGKINDELVFNSLTEELIPDVNEFLGVIENLDFG